MRSGPAAWGGIVELARISFGMSNELRKRSSRNRRIDQHDKRRTYETCNWRNVADEIEAEFLVKAHVDRCRSCGKEQRVTIRHSLDDGFSTDIGTSSRAVLDDELLTQVLREPLSY